LLVVRELLLGPKRFTDLRRSLRGISANVLTQRLNELERASVVRQRRLSPPVSAWVYELTSWGAELEPIILALGRWGARSPHWSTTGPINADSFALSLKAMFRPEGNRNQQAEYELRLAEDCFTLQLLEGELEITRGASKKPDVIIEALPGTLAALIYGGASLDDAIASGDLRYEGSEALLRHFLTLFSLPEPFCL
jgi:DNA-binding HxlR family transcriptional regulator/putative sterol carrier protein